MLKKLPSMFKGWVKSSAALAVLYYLINDRIASWLYGQGRIETDSGTTHRHEDLQQSLAYIDSVFHDYKHYADVNSFYGRIAEIGPGDNCGVALRFIHDGCVHVDLVDRFYSKRNPRYHAAVYRALLGQLPGLADRLGAVDLDNERSFGCLTRHYGPRAAAETFFRGHTKYDAIVSRAVMEHVYDPMGALLIMVSALNPGGKMLHKVDLRDHGMFTPHHHELKFLEVPDLIYRVMVRASGRPNRALIHQYRNMLEGESVKFHLLVTRLAGVGDISPHLPYDEIADELRQRSLSYVGSVRHRFAESLRSVRDEDLCVAGFFLIAEK